MDLEAEAHGQGDTLRRHRDRLLELARQRELSIGRVYEEVVSGETITSRPQMQLLLHDVEQGLYAGVLVMEVERLARGDTIDQGVVARTFQFSGTQIVTPAKTYDPSNDFDREYFEFGLYMSRREYQTINRRQQAGRLASVREGKWPYNRPPYGYRRVKLNGQKGWTLEAEEHAGIVCDVFRWYVCGAVQEDGTAKLLGTGRIAGRLNRMEISSPGGKSWTNLSVQSLLQNPVYAGWVRWGGRAQVKYLRGGEIVRSRPRAPDDSIVLCRGLHAPLVTQELFDRAQQRLSQHAVRPGPKGQNGVQNPLAGLVFCALCGRRMIRRTGGRGRSPLLLCPGVACRTVGADLTAVETAVVQGLRRFLADLEQAPPDASPQKAERQGLLRSLAAAEKSQEQLRQQEQQAYRFAEQGVYSPEILRQRIDDLSCLRETVSRRIGVLHDNLASLPAPRQELPIPAEFRHVLDCYELAETPAEKNELLRSVLERAEYSKTSGGRYQASDLQIRLFPRLPGSSPVIARSGRIGPFGDGGHDRPSTHPESDGSADS